MAEQLTSIRKEPECGANDSGPFAKTAEALWRAGLAVIPVGGEDGKKPLVTGFTKWKQRPGLVTILKWAGKYPDANVGVVTGPLSGVSVVDIDSADPNVQHAMVERFGDTLLKTRTPSGGYHLWYRHNGEASADLSSDVPVQVKAVGGFVVVPPSVRPAGQFACRRYEFMEGTVADLARLPSLKAGSIDRFSFIATNPSRLRVVKEGRRNNALFRHLKSHAPHCDDRDALVDVGVTFGQLDCDPILPSAEIIKTVDSVWKLKEEGRLWAKGAEPHVVVPAAAINILAADALQLLLKLQLSHFDRDLFALAPKSMAEAQVIPDWSHHKYRVARDELLEKGYLRKVHKGGARPGDASLFGFSNPPVVTGTKSVPNMTIHPPPRVLPIWPCLKENDLSSLR